MKSQSNLPRAQWSSYYSYILVTTGAIVGLGNIFHFPFLVIQFGGLFVLFYVLSELFLSIPLLFAELLIGRRGKQNPVGAISIIAMESDASHYWRWMGWLCFVILFLTLSYYTVSVAFPLGYFANTLQILFSHGLYSPHFSFLSYEAITKDFFVLEICFFIFLLAAMAVIVRGINRGLEGISLITVPMYFLLLTVLAIYVSAQGGFMASLYYLFHIPANQPLWPIVFAALTFAFFKLNVGMGSMIVYGSYLPYSVPLGQSTAIIVCIDAIASLLSYFIICPLMFQSHHFTYDEVLSYQNMMLIFISVPHGVMIAILFFFSAIVAAWTPTIAMAESATLTLIERLQISRVRASLIVGIGALLVGTVVVLSYTKWPHILLFSTWTIAGFIQNIASDIATPLSAFLIAIFCGRIVTRQITFDELGFKPVIYFLWRFLIRYFAPICIAVILFEIGFS